MPIHTLKLKPGIDVEQTRTLNEMGWTTSQLIRWREGLPEKLGGWSHLNTTPIIGTGRGIHGWTDLGGNPYIAVGTEQRLQVFSAGNITDITPIFRTSNINGPFTTQVNSNVVTVSDPAYVPSVGDWIYVATAANIGGLVLQGFYQVASVSGITYTFLAPTNATSTVNNGGATFQFTSSIGTAVVNFTLGAATFTTGSTILVSVSTAVDGVTLLGNFTVTVSGGFNQISAANAATSNSVVSENSGQVQIRYLLPSGNTVTAAVGGYGVGPYGAGPYGVATITTTTIPLRQWYLDNFGAFLIGNPTNGTLYVWMPPNAVNNVATAIGGQAPAVVNSSFIAMPQEMVIALGADPGSGIQDPNLIRWSDAGDYTAWTATALNQAGSFRLPNGSRIVGGIQGPQFTLIWTDVDFWLMQYLGPPLVWGFQKIATGTELLAGRASGIFSNVVYWASPDNFYRFDGNGTHILPCPIWDKFFKNINTQQTDKVFCAVNSRFSEVGWFYPSLNSTEVDSYIKVNVLEGTWDFGALPRTCWIDDNVLGPPIGVDLGGLLQQHDIEGIYDADGTPMMSSIQSGFMATADGTFQTFVERLIPDLIITGGNQRIFITLFVQNYPSDTIYSIGPMTFTPNLPYLITRMRGRTASIKIASSDLGVFWRLGALRYLSQPAGRR